MARSFHGHETVRAATTLTGHRARAPVSRTGTLWDTRVALQAMRFHLTCRAEISSHTPVTWE